MEGAEALIHWRKREFLRGITATQNVDRKKANDTGYTPPKGESVGTYFLIEGLIIASLVGFTFKSWLIFGLAVVIVYGPLFLLNVFLYGIYLALATGTALGLQFYYGSPDLPLEKIIESPLLTVLIVIFAALLAFNMIMIFTERNKSK